MGKDSAIVGQENILITMTKKPKSMTIILIIIAVVVFVYVVAWVRVFFITGVVDLGIKTTYYPKYGLPFVWVVSKAPDPAFPKLSSDVMTTQYEVSIFSPLLSSSTSQFVDQQSKRLAPTGVPPLPAYKGIKFIPSVPTKIIEGKEVTGGYIKAIDEKTNTTVWERFIYITPINKNLEMDVQEVFLKTIFIEKDELVVIDELGRRYEIDPTTGADIEDGKVLAGLIRHHFSCPAMPGVFFTYKLSEGWLSVNEGGTKKDTQLNDECRVYLSWRESTKPSAYISVNKIYMDVLLDTQKMKVNPHGVHYVPAVQGGSWASKDLTTHDFGQAMDFYFADIGVRVTYRLSGEGDGEGLKTFDKELFFRSVVDSFTATEQ